MRGVNTGIACLFIYYAKLAYVFSRTFSYWSCTHPRDACGLLVCLMEMPSVKPAYHEGKLSDASGVVVNACGYAFHVNAEVCSWRERRACWNASVSCVEIGRIQSSLHTVARSTIHPTDILQPCTELTFCGEDSALGAVHCNNRHDNQNSCPRQGHDAKQPLVLVTDGVALQSDCRHDSCKLSRQLS